MKVNYIMQSTVTLYAIEELSAMEHLIQQRYTCFFNKFGADKVFNLSYKRLNWLLSPK